MDRGYVGPDSEPLPDVRESRRTEEPEGAVVAPSVPTKRCTKCGLVKEATTENFYRAKACKSGVRPSCRDCDKAWGRTRAGRFEAGSLPRRLTTTKKCSSCGHTLALNKDNFGRRAYSPDGFRSRCRTCTSNDNVMYKLGVTTREYHALLAAQAGVCSICKNPPAGNRLAVDHDHTTGVVRGLLCMRCNLTLGVLESDDLTLFHAYLASPPAVAVLGTKKVPLK